MTFTAYSPRVARGDLSDDFSKSQAVADQVRKDIERDAIERALKWQSSEIRKNIRGAQPVQIGPSEPGMAEQLLGIGANYLNEKGVFDNGLRGIFGGGGSDPTFGTGIPSGSSLPDGSFGIGSKTSDIVSRHVAGHSSIQPGGGIDFSFLPWVN